ncbi:hypothetical protein AcidC75_18320 [Acidisoma sp. C75]
MNATRRSRSNSDLPNLAAFGLCRGGYGILSCRNSPLRRFNESLPCNCQYRPPISAFEQARAKNTFQLPQLLADRRLCQSKRFRGNGNAACFGDVKEGSELTDGWKTHKGNLF